MFSTNQRIKRLQSLIEKDSFNQGAHYMLGEEYLRDNSPMKAAAKFRRVIEMNPDHSRAWKMMAQAYDAAGVRKEALVAYETAARQFDHEGLPADAQAMRAAALEVE